MKIKKYIQLIVTILLLPAPIIAQGFDPGRYYTTANLNIRSTPMIGTNRIGHFLKGTEVNVTGVAGQWCQVEYQNFDHAYSFCLYLKKITSENIVVPTSSTHSSVNYLLANFNSWLLTDNTGINHINDSFWLASQKAKDWRSDAQIANFILPYSASKNNYCAITFISPSDPNEIYRAECPSLGSSQMIGNSLIIRSSLKGFALPSILFKDFISALQSDADLDAQFNQFFGNKANLAATFRLYKNKEDLLVWQATFIDSVTDRSVTVEADANNSQAMIEII